MTEKNPLVIIGQLESDLDDLYTSMEIAEFKDCLELAIRYVVKPDVLPDPRKVAVTVTQLSAYGLIFRAQYANYMGFKKGTKDAAAKKNTYRAIYDGIDKLVDSLKYLAK